MKTHCSYLTGFRMASACTLLALVATASTVHADDYTWNGNGAGTWNTSNTNWTGAGTTWINGSSNTASFGDITPTAAGYTVNLGTAITASAVTVNLASFTALFSGSALDVTTINTTNNGSIDMNSVLTGSHDLNYSAVSTNGGGRLNLKSVNTYTGDTKLTGTAALTLGNTTGSANNILPTGTTVYMDKGTQLLIFAGNTTQKITGLVSTGNGTGSDALINNRVGAGKTYELTIETKAATTSSFNGTLKNQNGSTEILNLIISGSGTQALSGTLSFNGTVTVSGGTLSLGTTLTAANSVIVSGGILTNTANVTLGAGAVSMSSGEINIRGAATTGTFTVAANQAFSTTGGKLTFNIGTASDQIIGSGVSSTFSIGSGTELALILGSGFSYANSYTLLSGFNSGSVASTGFTISGYDTTNYVASLSSTGVLSFSAASVPEPSTYAVLAGAAMLGFVAVRRRRTTR
jgi:autotransporter-associated beta strand protein